MWFSSTFSQFSAYLSILLTKSQSKKILVLMKSSLPIFLLMGHAYVKSKNSSTSPMSIHPMKDIWVASSSGILLIKHY